MADYQTRAAVREMQAIAEAEAVVRPYVGTLPAMDSAEGVYLAALKAMGKTSAQLRGLQGGGTAAQQAFDIVSGRGQRMQMAADSADADDRIKARFPNGNRLGRH